MQINFHNRKLEKTFNSAKSLQKQYGKRMARTIMRRLAVLKAAGSLALVPTTPLRGGTSWEVIERGNTLSILFIRTS
ncbi:MAG: hypothetical protein OXE97_12275 [Gammaproteobacteria bacterium]|nr:hypothetical protein [Gammaproteobacteria bacterium]